MTDLLDRGQYTTWNIAYTLYNPWINVYKRISHGHHEN